MIGIIVVSHSAKLAAGVKEIADQMNDGSVEIIAVGGADGGRLGTSTVKIQEAIEKLNSKEYILIFFDLGSAVMSSEMVLDIIDDKLRGKVRLIDAPLIEGVIAVTVHATTTNDISEIIAVGEESRELRKL